MSEATCQTARLSGLLNKLNVSNRVQTAVLLRNATA